MKKNQRSSSAAGKTTGKRPKYSMCLYVTGATARSTRAIGNLRKLCDEYLPGRYTLKVIDLYQQPHLAKQGRIIAAPTLVKSFPLPLRRFIGDLSNTRNLLTGLEIVSFAGGAERVTVTES